MPGNFYKNRFILLINWAESLGTAEGTFAATLLKDLWSDLKDSDFGDTDDDSDPREEVTGHA